MSLNISTFFAFLFVKIWKDVILIMYFRMKVKKMRVGNINKLLVIRKTDIGYVLREPDHEDVDYFLHNNDCAGKDPEIGSLVNAFMFYDHKGRLAATLEMPLITTTDCDFVEVVDIVNYGVYVNIGIRKDVLLSKDDLPLNRELWPQVGDKVYAYLQTDRDKALLIDLGTREDFLDIKEEAPEDVLGKKLQATVIYMGPAGVNIITDENYLGFIHNSEYKEEPRLGETLEARVINVKADGEINLSLIPQKEIAIKDDTQAILDYLESNDGFMPLWDKSSPEEIEDVLNISKAAFKRAVGTLMKQGLIVQDKENKCITLKEEE